MSEELPLYPNGMPHPPSALRRRVLAELAALVLLAALYVALAPERARALDIGLALVGFGLVGLYARTACERIWGPPSAPAFARVRHCTVLTLATTLPVLAVLALYGAWDAYQASGAWEAIPPRLFPPHFFLALLLYVPWALLQQTLFQFYLLGRLRTLLPFASPLLLSFLNGILYGAVHLPDWPLALLTMAGGVVWSYTYHRDRYVLPIALSHAVLGASFFYWVRGSDLLVKVFQGG